MQTRAADTEPSLTEILYALILAFAPYIESLLAEARQEGRKPSPGLRSLAKTLGALRVLAALFGAKAPTPQSPARQRRRQSPAAKSRPHATTPNSRAPFHAPIPLKTRHPRITPPPWRPRAA